MMSERNNDPPWPSLLVSNAEALEHIRRQTATAAPVLMARIFRLDWRRFRPRKVIDARRVAKRDGPSVALEL
jgi:hypothetical protein